VSHPVVGAATPPIRLGHSLLIISGPVASLGRELTGGVTGFSASARKDVDGT
jgi:hypothetical protein